MLRKRNSLECRSLYKIPRFMDVTYWIVVALGVWLISAQVYSLTNHVCKSVLSTAVYIHLGNISAQHAVANLLFYKLHRWNVLLFFILGVVVAPVCEETFFRGWMDGAITRRMGDFWGISLSAFIFGIVHLVPIEFPALMLTGICLSIAKRKTGSQWSNITIHSIINSISIILIIATK